MKCRKIFLRVCAILCICVITGLVTACIIAKPINLTDEEILYYTNTAEKVWYEGLNSVEKDDSIRIVFNLNEKEVQVLPINTNKQSVTVDFSSSDNPITVNDPVVSFWGCFFFYGAFFGLIIYGIICFCIFITKERHKK